MASQGWSFVLTEHARILVADDDPILREFASVQLSTPVATVECVPDGAEAWKRLQDGDFDLALVDIEMPKLDGFALVERIRADARLQYLPVVMLTGREDIASIDRAYRVGATSFVTKPVNWRQLSHQIRYVLRTSRLEGDLRAATVRAEEAARLKGNLLGVLRHEFRTPLNSIIGFAELLGASAKEAGSDTCCQHARFITDSGHQLLTMFSEMMALAELGSSDVKLSEDVYGLPRLIELALATVAQVAQEHGVATMVDGEVPDLDILCDRDQMLRMLRHLLHNAVVHGGKNVRLGVERAADGGLTLTINDDGPGIPPDRLEACLEAFGQGDMTLTRASSGLGLGLPLAKRIAALHGGALDIDSTPGAGTCARINLPANRLSGAPEQTTDPNANGGESQTAQRPAA